MGCEERGRESGLRQDPRYRLGGSQRSSQSQGGATARGEGRESCLSWRAERAPGEGGGEVKTGDAGSAMRAVGLLQNGSSKAARFNRAFW